jgi:3-isopropylmalate/(R)-2-methylmalate dehydratase large subunit
MDLGGIDCLVAAPFSPGNVSLVRDQPDVIVDQVFIGSCTGGKITDLRRAAAIMQGHKLAKNTRCVVIPATPAVYLEAIQEGLMEIFLNAGCFVSSPTCGPCAGFQLGVLAAGETCVSTTPRNFRGRMGHVDSRVYLSGPYVAAAAAITGKLVHPAEVMP